MAKPIKQVFNKKMAFSFKGLLRNTIRISIHILTMLLYFAIIELIVHFQFQNFNLFLFWYRKWFLIYLLFLGPFITGIAHIYYLDTGNISLKAFVWLHTWFIMIAILILIIL